MTHPTTAAPVAADKLRILIAEDNADCARSLAMLLALHGHDTVVAHDGRTALALQALYQPDVLLLDIGLPALDGYQVAQSVKQQPARRRPFMVAITGYSGADWERRSAEAGIDLHLTKPVNPFELTHVLRRFGAVAGP